MDDMDRRIRALVAEGFSDRQIAREVKLSRTAVRKRRAKFPAAAEPVDDGSPDPWDDTGDETDLALYDIDAEREHWPTEPFLFVGYERKWFPRGRGEPGYWADTERWIDAEGRPLATEFESAEMALWRYKTHVRHDLGNFERADALAADGARQRAAYDEKRTG